MAELTAELFRDFFGGSWSAKVTKNGEFQRELIFNWPELSGKYTSLGTETGMIVPPDTGILDDTRQVAISGWRSDTKRWAQVWHNEFGGYGEVQWTSQEFVNEETVIYGFCHECKQESDAPTEHIIMCQLLNRDNFRYTLRSFRKGILEIDAKRIRTSRELNALLLNQAGTVLSFAEILKM